MSPTRPPMRPALATLLTTLYLTTPALADTCADGPGRTASNTPVYVVLFGYPYGPSDSPLKPLNAVDDDLLQMATVFNAMGPAELYVHGESIPSLTRRFDAALRPPTWRALRATLDDVEARLRSDGRRGRVYVYFAGHGARRPADEGPGPSGYVFARPEPGATERGYDGNLTGALLADEVWHPLSTLADVNLIADACQSFYLLTARGRLIERRRGRVPPLPDFASDFALLFPTVGAAVATESATYEDTAGGLFSHALRSAAIGPADLDQDGIITYGEFHYALNWILSTTTQASEATVLPPGQDATAPFIDWRGSTAARVCIPPALAGRRLIATDDGLSATLHMRPTEPYPVWLEPGRRYTLVGKESQTNFIAGNGPLTHAHTEEIAQRGERWPALFTQPIIADKGPPLMAATPEDPGPYYGIGAVGAYGYVVDDRARNDATRWTPAADLSGRIGLGAHRFITEAGWAWLRSPTQDQNTARGAEDRIDGSDQHSISGRVGYEYLLSDRTWEFGIGGLIGGAVLVDRDGTGPLLAETTARLTALRPIARGRFALRFDARVAVTPSEQGFTTLFRLGAGVDYEDLFD